MTHWTARDPQAFAFSLRASFCLQLGIDTVMGYLSLGRAVRLAQERGQKVALIAYNDDDVENVRGPINGQVFVRCWERQGKPHDFFDLGEGAE